MTALQIVDVDPLDPTQDRLVTAWAGIDEAASKEAYGDLHTAWSAEEIRAQYQVGTEDARRAAFAALQDGVVVGTAEVELPLADNTSYAQLAIAVLPQRRRRGIASALLAHAEQLAAGAGRSVFGGESDVATGREDPAEGFAARFGYRREQTELRSDLALPIDERARTTAETEASAHSAGYTVLTSWDGIPDAWLADRAKLSQRMSTDIPLGGLAWEEEQWDAGRVRRDYELARAQGRRIVESVVRHDASGRLVGFTQIAVASHTPDVGYQWDTLILPDHRGHRLGMLVKLANLRAVREQLPEVTRIATWNAAENEPMLRVNRALGFAVTGRLAEWQKRT